MGMASGLPSLETDQVSRTQDSAASGLGARMGWGESIPTPTTSPACLHVRHLSLPVASLSLFWERGTKTETEMSE